MRAPCICVVCVTGFNFFFLHIRQHGSGRVGLTGDAQIPLSWLSLVNKSAGAAVQRHKRQSAVLMYNSELIYFKVLMLFTSLFTRHYSAQ